MLNNRIIEQLEWSEQITVYNRRQLERLHYQLIKCHIDLATTLLIFGGRYADTYQARAKALSNWAFEVKPDSGMNFLHFVAQRVSACTAFKLNPNSESLPLGVRVHAEDPEVFRGDLRRALTDFVPLVHEIWRWEAAAFSRTENHENATHETLQEAVLKVQPLKEKLRGWAKLALMPEIRGQRGFSARMSRLALRGSPRYLVYDVAAQLYFKLPKILSEGVPENELAPLARDLPVIFDQNEAEQRPWWRLRANVISSWHAFLRTHFA